MEWVLQLTEQHLSLSVAGVSRPVIMQAALVRAGGLEVAGSLVLATGVFAECDATLTNDRRWRLWLERLSRRPQMMAGGEGALELPRMLYLDDFVGS